MAADTEVIDWLGLDENVDVIEGGIKKIAAWSERSCMSSIELTGSRPGKLSE